MSYSNFTIYSHLHLELRDCEPSREITAKCECIEFLINVVIKIKKKDTLHFKLHFQEDQNIVRSMI